MFFFSSFLPSTVEARIIEPCANVIGLSTLSEVKDNLSSPVTVTEGGNRVFFPPVPQKIILDFIAHGSIIRVFTASILSD